MKKIMISLAAIAAISTAALANDKATDYTSGGAGLMQKIVPATDAPEMFWTSKGAEAKANRVDNDLERDKSAN